MKHTYPITSHIAKAMKSEESKQHDYNKIIEALKVIGQGNYEQIADTLTWRDINKCSRRLKEMIGKEMIYNTGLKNLTKRNRPAFMYSIKSNGSKESAVETNYKKPELTSTQYANNIIESAKGCGFIQPELF